MYLTNWPLLKRIGEVNVSDTTTADSSNTADNKKIQTFKKQDNIWLFLPYSHLGTRIKLFFSFLCSQLHYYPACRQASIKLYLRPPEADQQHNSLQHIQKTK